MLQNAYFLAKIGVDTAENEQHLAEIFPKTGAARAGVFLQAKAAAASRSAAATSVCPPNQYI